MSIKPASNLKIPQALERQPIDMRSPPMDKKQQQKPALANAQQQKQSESAQKLQVVDLSSSDESESGNCQHVSEIKQLKEQLSLSVKSNQQLQLQIQQQAKQIQQLSAKSLENSNKAKTLVLQGDYVKQLEENNRRLQEQLQRATTPVMILPSEQNNGQVPVVKPEPFDIHSEQEEELLRLQKVNSELSSQIKTQKTQIHSIQQQLTESSRALKKFDAQTDYVATIEEMNKLLQSQLKATMMKQGEPQTLTDSGPKKNIKQAEIQISSEAEVQLKKTVQQQQKQITDLQQKIKVKTSEFEDQSNKLQKLQEEFGDSMAQFQVALQEKQEENDALKESDQLAKLGEDVKTMRRQHQQQLLEAQKKNEKLSLELVRLKSEQKGLSQDSVIKKQAEAEQKCLQLTAELIKLHSECDSLKTKLKNHKADNDQAMLTLVTKQNEEHALMEKYRSNATYMAVQLNTFAAKLQPLQNENAELKQNVEHLTSLLKASEAKLQQQVNETNSTKAVLKTVSADLKCSESKIQKMRDESEYAQRQSVTACYEVIQLRKQLSDNLQTVEKAKTAYQYYQELELKMNAKVAESERKVQQLDSLNRKLLEQYLTAKKEDVGNKGKNTAEKEESAKSQKEPQRQQEKDIQNTNANANQEQQNDTAEPKKPEQV